MLRKSKKRIHGTDRAYMMIARDIRRRWFQYGENRRIDKVKCEKCKKRRKLQIDHIKPMGPYPRVSYNFSNYIFRMFYFGCQALCKPCHKKKTDAERKRRKNEVK